MLLAHAWSSASTRNQRKGTKNGRTSFKRPCSRISTFNIFDSQYHNLPKFLKALLPSTIKRQQRSGSLIDRNSQGGEVPRTRGIYDYGLDSQTRFGVTSALTWKGCDHSSRCKTPETTRTVSTTTWKIGASASWLQTRKRRL